MIKVPTIINIGTDIKEYFPECDPVVKAADFSSSYPYCALAYRFPMDKFTPMHDCQMDEILSTCEDYAYVFKLIMIKPRLKNDFIPMPALQFSKCIDTIDQVLKAEKITKDNFHLSFYYFTLNFYRGQRN